MSLRNVPVNFPQKSYITTLEPWQSLPFYISIFPHKVPNLFPDRADECFIFTDGSLKNPISGCSVVVTISTEILKTNFFRLPDDTFIFEAETRAIITALHFIKKVQSLYTNFTIHTDSKAVLASLSSRQKAGSTTNKVQALATSVGSVIQLQFVWVKGHAGTVGNILANNLAKQCKHLPVRK